MISRAGGQPAEGGGMASDCGRGYGSGVSVGGRCPVFDLRIGGHSGVPQDVGATAAGSDVKPADPCVGSARGHENDVYPIVARQAAVVDRHDSCLAVVGIQPAAAGNVQRGNILLRIESVVVVGK